MDDLVRAGVPAVVLADRVQVAKIAAPAGPDAIKLVVADIMAQPMVTRSNAVRSVERRSDFMPATMALCLVAIAALAAASSMWVIVGAVVTVMAVMAILIMVRW